MKKLLIALLTFAMLFSLVACEGTDTPEITKSTPSAANNTADSNQATTDSTTPVIQQPINNQRVIELNMDNYQSFLTCSTGNISSVSGVLLYAYYENVVVTYNVIYQPKSYYPGADSYQGDFSIVLNAAGNATFSIESSDVLAVLKPVNGNSYEDLTDLGLAGYDKTITLKSVSGKVIFTP